MNEFLDALKAIDLITDYSQDGNASPKVERRLIELFGKPVVKWYAQDDATFGAQIVEALSVTNAARLIVVNKAWRDGTTENGDPFGVIDASAWRLFSPQKNRDALIISTYGRYLAELARLNLAGSPFYPFDMDAIFDSSAKGAWALPAPLRTSQFRSYDWIPFLSLAIAANEEKVPMLKPIDLPTHEGRPDKIWWIDNHDNAKTLLRCGDLFKESDPWGKSVRTIIGDLKLYPHMTAVPHGEVGLVRGSSGSRKVDLRYLEVQIHGGHAAEVYPQLKVGTALLS